MLVTPLNPGACMFIEPNANSKIPNHAGALMRTRIAQPAPHACMYVEQCTYIQVHMYVRTLSPHTYIPVSLYVCICRPPAYIRFAPYVCRFAQYTYIPEPFSGMYVYRSIYIHTCLYVCIYHPHTYVVSPVRVFWFIANM